MTRKRILIVNSTLHVGGAEQVAANLAERLDPEQFQVAVCYLKENGVVGEAMVREGVELVALPGSRSGERDYLTSLKLRRLIQQRSVDLIHTHDVHGLVDGSVCRLTMPRLRLVHTFHYGNYPNREPRRRRIERLLWRVPDAAVAVGQAQCDAIRQTYGIAPGRLEVIRNGVDPHALPFDDGLMHRLREERRPVIGSISTMIEQKGIPVMLDALAVLKRRGHDFLAVLVGEGAMRADMEEKAKALGLGDNVWFTGRINEAATRALPRFDIFVQSSLWEAMSIVVLEAMAAARPMVVTAVGENPHVVRDRESGMLVPPGDPASLADALDELLARPELRDSLGQRARAEYETHYTVEHMTRGYERLYRRLCTGSQGE
jgi:glycosyltransferase involved in cell wall biosynthesis